MKPSIYLADIVDPTVAEFEREPTSIRKAFLACVVTYHFADCASVATGQKVRNVVPEINRLASEFQVVRDVAILAKHLYLDPKHAANKGRHLFELKDVHVGSAAAFDDGTYWDDGTAWTDSPDVARVRGAEQHPIDLLYCIQASIAAIREFLESRPDL